MEHQQQQQQEHPVASVDENFSQFSDNAVLSPPTANNDQQVLPADDCAGSSVTDLLFTSNRVGLTNDAGCTVLPSSPQSVPPPHEGSGDDVVTNLESPDIENTIFQAQPLSKEVDERTADTVIVPSEDTNAKNNKESPFKMTTSGVYLKYLCCYAISCCNNNVSILHHCCYKVVLKAGVRDIIRKDKGWR